MIQSLAQTAERVALGRAIMTIFKQEHLDNGENSFILFIKLFPRMVYYLSNFKK
jgi:hypothetical protein